MTDEKLPTDEHLVSLARIECDLIWLKRSHAELKRMLIALGAPDPGNADYDPGNYAHRDQDHFSADGKPSMVDRPTCDNN